MVSIASHVAASTASYNELVATTVQQAAQIAALQASAGATTLAPLTLAAPSVTENAAPGAIISGIVGKTVGSTLSLASDDGGRFAISGTNLVAGLTNIDYEAATSRTVVIRETLAGATNSPRETSLAVGVVNINEQPSLRALLLSSTSLTVGTAASGTINEAATGSTITPANLPSGLTINGPARTWAWSGTGTAGTVTTNLTEALGDSPNSPRTTSINVTIAAAAGLSAPTPNPITARTEVGQFRETGYLDMGANKPSMKQEYTAKDGAAWTAESILYMGCTTGSDTASRGLIFAQIGPQYGVAFYLKDGVQTAFTNGVGNTNFGRALTRNDVLEFVTENGGANVYLNGQIQNARNGMTIAPAYFQEAFPPGTELGRFSRMFNYTPNPSPLTTTLSGGSVTPLIVTSIALDDNSPVFDIKYTGSPPGFVTQIRNSSGTALTPWSAALKVSNTAAGVARYKGTGRAPAGNTSYQFVIAVALSATEPDTTKAEVVRVEITPGVTRFGDNLADVGGAYTSTAAIADVFRAGYYQDATNTSAPPFAHSQPGLASADGWPLSPNAIRQLGHPLISGTTMLATWDGDWLIDQLTPTEGDTTFTEKTLVSANNYTYKHNFTMTGRFHTFGNISFKPKPDGTSVAPPTEVKIYKQGADRTAFWNQTYLDHKTAASSGYNGPGRHMDNTRTNPLGATAVNWAMKSDPTKAFDGPLGLSIERIIELHNYINRDVWYCMPPWADDDFIQKVALAFHNGSTLSQGKPWSNGLNPGLQIFFEWGNELWHSSFLIYAEAKKRYAQRTGEAELSDSAGGTEQRYKEQAFQHKRMVTQIRSVIPTHSSRCVFVYGGWASGGPYGYTIAMNEGIGPFTTGVAVAPYFLMSRADIQALPDRLPTTIEGPLIQKSLILIDELKPFRNLVRSNGHRFFTYEAGVDWDQMKSNPTYPNCLSPGQAADFRESKSWYRFNYAVMSKWKNEMGDLWMQYTDYGRALGLTSNPNSGSSFQWGLELYEGQEDRYGVQAMMDVQAGAPPRY